MARKAKAAGKPRGRPPGSIVRLQTHPCRTILACADMLHWFGNMPRQKAYLLLTTFMTAIDAEPLPFDAMSTKMRRVFEEQGGIAMRFTLPAKGNPDSKNIKQHVQPVDTLGKMSARYTSSVDLAYRHSMALLVYLSMFAEGSDIERQKMVDLLVLQLGPDDPQVRQIADRALVMATAVHRL
jgi:hypothetical protein